MANTPADKNPQEELDHLGVRLQELNNSATQILLFLSFATVGTVTYLTSALDPARKGAVHASLHWWIGAIFPTVSCIIPLNELEDREVRWHRFLLWTRFFLRWAAIFCIFVGAIQFLKAI